MIAVDSQAGTQRHGRYRRLVIGVWIALSVVASIPWIFGSPLGGSPDEPSHMAYAWGVATGQGFGDPDPTCDQGPCPRTNYVVPPGLIPEPGCYVFRPGVSAGCAGASEANPYASYMTRYPPPYYFVVGAALRLSLNAGLDPVQAGFAGRMAGAIISLSILIPAGVAVTMRDRRVLPYLIATLVPMSLFMINTINPSGVEISAAIGMAVALGVLARNPSAGARFLLLYSATWLAWTRPVGWLWASTVLIFGFGLVAARNRGMRVSFGTLGWALPGSVFAIATAVGWFVYALAARSAVGTGSSLPDGSIERLLAIVFRWGGMIKENLGVLGWLDTPIPELLMLGSISLMVILLVGGLLTAVWRRGLSIVVAYFVSVVMGVTILMMIQQFLWQGRYVWPALAAGLILIGFESNPGPKSERASFLIASGLWLIAEISSLWVYARYAVGLQRGARYLVPNLSGTADWASPLGAPAIVIVGIVGVVAVSAVLAWNGTRIGRLPAPPLDLDQQAIPTGSLPQGEDTND